MKLRIEKNWLLIAMITALPVLAADGLNVKTGAWQTTLVMKTSGMAMPESAMANMNAQQRAQMEAMMKQMSNAAPKTITEKSCITEKDLKEGAFRAQQRQKDSKCTYKTLANTSRHQEVVFECPGERGVSGGRMVVDAVDSSNIKGDMHVKTATGTVDTTFTGKWVGPTCTAEDKD